MIITCTKENLKKSLGIASKVVGTASTLPILNHLLLKAEGGRLQIVSTNLEIAIKTLVGGQIEKTGQIAAPARTLTDLVNNLPEERITLTTKENNLLIKTKKSESLLRGLPAEEFPLIPEVKPNASTTLAAGELAEAITGVAFAAVFSETQPELSGVLFSFEEKQLRLAATERYRLAEKIVSLSHPSETPQKIIIPNRAVVELSRILVETPKSAEIVISENQVLFRTENTELTSRLIEGQYPDYQQIVPKEFITQITLDTQEFLSALKLSGLFVAENNNVELEIKKSQESLVLKSSSQKYGSNITNISGQVEGGDNRIIFNYRYIMDCLNHISQKQAVLKIINNSSPAMIVPAGGQDNYLYLVMPIKT